MRVTRLSCAFFSRTSTCQHLDSYLSSLPSSCALFIHRAFGPWYPPSLLAAFESYTHTRAKMVEPAKRRSGLLNHARSLNPLETRQPLSNLSKLPAAIEEPSKVAEERITIIGSGPEKARSSYDSQPSLAHRAAFQVFPESICPLCLNLGQELWDPKYRFEHRLSWVPKHLVDAREVVRAAERGCSGCEIVAWVLRPYMTHHEGHGNVIRLKFGDGYCVSSGGTFFRELNFNGSIVSTGSTLTNIAVKSTPCTSGRDLLIPAKSTSDL